MKPKKGDRKEYKGHILVCVESSKSMVVYTYHDDQGNEKKDWCTRALWDNMAGV